MPAESPPSRPVTASYRPTISTPSPLFRRPPNSPADRSIPSHQGTSSSRKSPSPSAEIPRIPSSCQSISSPWIPRNSTFALCGIPLPAESSHPRRFQPRNPPVSKLSVTSLLPFCQNSRSTHSHPLPLTFPYTCRPFVVPPSPVTPRFTPPPDQKSSPATSPTSSPRTAAYPNSNYPGTASSIPNLGWDSFWNRRNFPPSPAPLKLRVLPKFHRGSIESTSRQLSFLTSAELHGFPFARAPPVPIGHILTPQPLTLKSDPHFRESD